ncbi:MAG: SDR family NAD(P)-dependent oxidoreductase, partial [Gammaproteobacteria bacterium]|nr:SDR family NAD(P)-dependent oxidoreductase [Gammaproteobacteria bacterium]MDX2486015.1 SDR family NAD(P)-dependent oxidoreductase [Gammaproteobacteria bacterium]
MNITDINVNKLPSSIEDLKDHVYLITGAAGAVGSAVAITLGISGATVILVDRNSRGLDATYDQITEAGGAEPIKLELDLAATGIPQYEEMADLIKNEFSRLDGLIHCAVEPGTLTPLSQYTMEMLNKALLVNLSAPYMMTQCCLDLLREAKNASVIFTSTEVARKGKAYWGGYSISGFALEGLAQIWADELETNTSIRINTLDTGPVRSLLLSRIFPGEERSAVPTAESVVPAYLYLLTS